MAADAKQQVLLKLQAAQGWYEAREPRERLVLKLLAAVVAALLVFSLWWMPMWGWRAQAMQAFDKQAQLLAWIEANESALSQRMSSNARPSFSGDWTTAISRSVSDAGLSLKSMTPEGSDALRIQLEGQPFAETLGWLQGVQVQMGATVANLEITPASQPGLINFRATLRRGA